MSFSARLYDVPVEPALRRRTNFAATLSAQCGQPHHVIVHNLSSSGVLVESYHPLEIGDSIALEISDVGAATARVTWKDDALYDCAFDRPLRADIVRSKITNAKVVWGNFPRMAPPRGDLQPADLIPLIEAPVASAPAEALPRPGTRLLLIVGAAALCWIPPGALLLWWLG